MENEPLGHTEISDEMRRRKVLRATTLYAIGGWCALQWFDTLFARLAWPEWTLKLVLTIIVLGFPMVVALAWAFEITEDGVRRADPDRVPGAEPMIGRRVVNISVTVLVGATMAMLFL